MASAVHPHDPATLVGVFALLLTLVRPTGPMRLWMTMYMDDDENCMRNIRNDDMNEGDFYAINSDSWHGEAHMNRRPAECSISVNFGDRLVAVQVAQWWCERDQGEPFLAIYDTCQGEREDILARYDCSTKNPITIYSSGTCLTVYHYRGHTRWRYYFALEVVAKYEVIAFPAGGIAAIIIASIVVVMVIVKVGCVISGFENRLPVIPTETEDIKQTLLMGGAAAAGSRRNSREKDGRVTPPASGGDHSGEVTATGTRRTVMLSSLQGHTLLRTTTTTPMSSPSTSTDVHRDVEADDASGDMYNTATRTTRFTGVRAPRILKL